MAKNEEEVTQNKPVEVRPQTEDEIRGRLKSQGKIKDTPKEEDGGVRELTEEEALVGIEERKDRKALEATEDDPNVRQMTKKDVVLRQTAAKKREEEKKEKDEKDEPSRVQTQEDITKRKDKKPEPEPEPEKKETSEPPEIYAKDTVSFKDDDGNLVTGKVKRVTAKGDVLVETEEAVYTVPGDEVTKEEGE